jgi:hypothetical protein
LTRSALLIADSSLQSREINSAHFEFHSIQKRGDGAAPAADVVILCRYPFDVHQLASCCLAY